MPGRGRPSPACHVPCLPAARPFLQPLLPYLRCRLGVEQTPLSRAKGPRPRRRDRVNGAGRGRGGWLNAARSRTSSRGIIAGAAVPEGEAAPLEQLQQRVLQLCWGRAASLNVLHGQPPPGAFCPTADARASGAAGWGRLHITVSRGRHGCRQPSTCCSTACLTRSWTTC